MQVGTKSGLQSNAVGGGAGRGSEEEAVSTMCCEGSQTAVCGHVMKFFLI